MVSSPVPDAAGVARREQRVFRRIGREIKDLDFDLVARQPILTRLLPPPPAQTPGHSRIRATTLTGMAKGDRLWPPLARGNHDGSIQTDYWPATSGKVLCRSTDRSRHRRRGSEFACLRSVVRIPSVPPRKPHDPGNKAQTSLLKFSVQERRLYAGCRLGRNQATPQARPRLTNSPWFRHRLALFDTSSAVRLRSSL